MNILNSRSVKTLLVTSMVALLPAYAAGQTTSQARQLNIQEIRQITGELQAVSNELDGLLAMSGSDSTTTSAADVTVVKGDYLSALARKHLGSASRWPELVAWNQDRYPSLLKNPDLIHIGWKLRMAPPSAAKPNAPAQANAGNTATTAATSSSSGSSVGSAPTASAAPKPSVSTSPSTSGTTSTPNTTPRRVPAPGEPIITRETKVLHIGDSHTCGVYGKAMDELMRGTGATVSTYGVSGSSPSWWFNETVGKSGYYSKDEQGKVDQPADWRTPRATPKLTDLIKQKKPDVLMVSMGANFATANDTTIRAQVKSISDVAKQYGTQLVWIGPPDGRTSQKPTAIQERLYKILKAAVIEFGGTFVDSRPFTEYPEKGGDGIHYGGTEGTKVAQGWAQSVYDTIQGKK